MTHVFRSIVLLGAGALVLTACQPKGADTSDSGLPTVATSAIAAPTIAAPPMPNACDLLTAEDAQAVLAQAAGLMSDDPENCLWASMENPGQISMLMLQVSEADDPALAQILFDALIGNEGDADVAGGAPAVASNGQLLAGLGDAAWMSTATAEVIGARQLHVRKGVRLLSLNVTGMASADSNSQAALAERLHALASSAAAKL